MLNPDPTVTAMASEYGLSPDQIEALADRLLEAYQEPHSRYAELAQRLASLPEQPSASAIEGDLLGLPIQVDSEEPGAHASLESRPASALAKELAQSFEEFQGALEATLGEAKDSFLQDFRQAVRASLVLGNQATALVSIGSWWAVAASLEMEFSCRHALMEEGTPEQLQPWLAGAPAPSRNWDRMFLAWKSLVERSRWGLARAWGPAVLDATPESLSSLTRDASAPAQWKSKWVDQLGMDLLVREAFASSESLEAAIHEFRVAFFPDIDPEALPWHRLFSSRQTQMEFAPKLASPTEVSERLAWLASRHPLAIEAWLARSDGTPAPAVPKEAIRDGMEPVSIHALRRAFDALKGVTPDTMEAMLGTIDSVVPEGGYLTAWRATCLDLRLKPSSSPTRRPRL